MLATPLANLDDIQCIADRILTELRRPVDIASTLLHPTASMGAALFPDAGQDGDSLLSAASAACRVVKDHGRDGFHVHGRELEGRVAS